jgi:hypothetical protein
MKSDLGACMNWLRMTLTKLSDWYWGDPVAAERHRIEEDARRLKGTITWQD